MDPLSDPKSVEQNFNALAKRMSDVDSMDLQTRRALQTACQKLSFALETPGDTFQRIAFLPLQATTIRIAVDLDLFERLGKVGANGMSTHEIAKETGADSTLLTRILRHLAATGVINETSHDHFSATRTSKALSNQIAQAGVKHFHDFVGPAWYKLPAFLAKTKYQNPEDAMNGPFQYAYNTELHGFAWIMQPENSTFLNNFNTWLAGSHEGIPKWLDWYPFEKEVVQGLDRDEKSVAVVDVGGGLGHELLEMQTKYSGLSGRLVLQDLPESIKNVPKTDVFEPTVHDFFTPQPVKGARIYYFRMILHDWLDDKAQLILQNIIPAMRKGYSKIIINEMVIPDVGSSWRDTQWDLTMMACLSAMERTEKQWRALLTSAGLEIVKIWTHPDSTESIIEAVPA